MSESELIEVLYIFVSDAEAQFEFWMAVTIALIVASYTAGNKLTFLVRVPIAGLYLLTCGLFYLRYVDAIDNILLVTQQLESIGSFYNPGHVELTPIIRTVVVVGTTALAVLITVAPNLASNDRKTDKEKVAT